MYPVLYQFSDFTIFGFNVPPIAIFSHGIFEAIGFLLAMSWFLRVAQRRHFHLEFIADHFFSLALFSILFARIGYLFVFFKDYSASPLSMLSVWDGGYLLWTGLIGFLGTLYYHCEKKQEKIGQWLDIIIPAAVIAFVFETFGAFLSGQKFGIQTDLPWGITYENPQVPFIVPVHPVQLYLLFFLLLLLVILQILHRKKLRESFTGLVGLTLLAFFSLLTEYFRGDEMLVVAGLRFTQIAELLVMGFALFLLFFQGRRKPSLS